MPLAIRFPKLSAATLQWRAEDGKYPGLVWVGDSCPTKSHSALRVSKNSLTAPDQTTAMLNSGGHCFQPCHYRPLLKWKRDGSLANHPAKNLKAPDPSLRLRRPHL